MRIGRRRTIVTTVIVIAIAALGLWVRDVTMPPETRTEHEEKMERPFLAYEVWDDTPVVLFHWSPSDEYVYIDRLRLDWMNMGVPFFPRWQWTGVWSYIASTSDPASIAFDRRPWGTALFGQVNDSAIVAVEVVNGSVLTIYPVSIPGFLVELNDDEPEPDEYRFLDADGVVIWSSTGSEVGPDIDIVA